MPSRRSVVATIAATAAIALATAPPAAAASITSPYGCGTVVGGFGVQDMRTTIDAPATARVGQTIQVPVRLERLDNPTQGPGVTSSTTWEIHLGGATSAVLKANSFTSPAPWKFQGTLTVTFAGAGQVSYRGGYLNAGWWGCRPYPNHVDSTTPIVATTTVS